MNGLIRVWFGHRFPTVAHVFALSCNEESRRNGLWDFRPQRHLLSQTRPERFAARKALKPAFT